MAKLERLRLKTGLPGTLSPPRSPSTCASSHAAPCSRGLQSAPASPQRQSKVAGTRAPCSFEPQRPATQRLGRLGPAGHGPLPFQSYKQPEPLHFLGSVHEPEEARRRAFRSRERALFYHKLTAAATIRGEQRNRRPQDGQAAREGLREPSDPSAFERCVSPKSSAAGSPKVVARRSPSTPKRPLEPCPVRIPAHSLTAHRRLRFGCSAANKHEETTLSSERDWCLLVLI